MDWSSLLKKPSAFLPLAMSGAALALVLGFLAMVGVVREADEGSAARIFQLLIAAQVPIVLAFVLRWIPVEPRKGSIVLALQVGAALVAVLPVLLLGL